jgi:hypothetical protein
MFKEKRNRLGSKKAGRLKGRDYWRSKD